MITTLEHSKLGVVKLLMEFNSSVNFVADGKKLLLVMSHIELKRNSLGKVEALHSTKWNYYMLYGYSDNIEEMGITILQTKTGKIKTPGAAYKQFLQATKLLNKINLVKNN
jgi:hypothetical protein